MPRAGSDARSSAALTIATITRGSLRASGALSRLALACLGLASASARAEPDDPVPRFAISAEIRPLHVSDDRRYVLEATARFTPETGSTDGRFQMKAIGGADCNPNPVDPQFSDGFELP